MSFLISPTEPRQIQAMGVTSSIPERLGVDILWDGRLGLCGVQRKTVSDLIASVRDGRLGKEIEQMERLTFKGFVVEGRPQWTLDGELLGDYGRWSEKQHRGVLMSVQSRGIITLHSDGHLGTIRVVEHMAEWSRKEMSESSMLYRGNGRGDNWGQMTDRSTGVHFLSGIPGIGVELAGRIFDHFGRVPISWSVTPQELMEVKGLGKKKVAQLVKVLT